MQNDACAGRPPPVEFTRRNPAGLKCPRIRGMKAPDPDRRTPRSSTPSQEVMHSKTQNRSPAPLVLAVIATVSTWPGLAWSAESSGGLLTNAFTLSLGTFLLDTKTELVTQRHCGLARHKSRLQEGPRIAGFGPVSRGWGLAFCKASPAPRDVFRHQQFQYQESQSQHDGRRYGLSGQCLGQCREFNDGRCTVL